MSKDLNKILHRLDLALHKTREAAELGMAKAGMQLLADAIQREPTVPFKEGELRGSGSVAVNGSNVGTSKDLGFTKGDPESSGSDSKGGRNEITAAVGFNKPYAAKLHFIKPPGGFSEPSAGTNYLFGKMTAYHRTYFNIIAREIREVL